MRAGTYHNGWPGCFIVRWGALSKTLAQSGPHGKENLLAFLQVSMVRLLGVIFTPSEAPTSGTVSSTRGRACCNLRRGFNAEASPYPCRPNGATSGRLCTSDMHTTPASTANIHATPAFTQQGRTTPVGTTTVYTRTHRWSQVHHAEEGGTQGHREED